MITIAQAIVRHVRQLHPSLNIVVRAEGEEQMEALYGEGVYMVILPELEAGLEIARQALLHLQIPIPVIQRFTDSIRRELYHPISESTDDQREIRLLKNAKDLLELSWERVPACSPLAGHSIRDLEIRRRTGASIVGVLRNGEFTANPHADFRIDADDLVAVIGNAGQREAFQGLTLCSLETGASPGAGFSVWST